MQDIQEPRPETPGSLVTSESRQSQIAEEPPPLPEEELPRRRVKMQAKLLSGRRAELAWDAVIIMGFALILAKSISDEIHKNPLDQTYKILFLLTFWQHLVNLSSRTYVCLNHLLEQEPTELAPDMPNRRLTISSSVAVFYWALASSSTESTGGQFIANGLPALINLLDATVRRAPSESSCDIGIKNAGFSLIYGLVNCVSVFAGITDEEGRPYIYKVLDWKNDPGNAALALGLTTLIFAVMTSVSGLVVQGSQTLVDKVAAKLDYCMVDGVGQRQPLIASSTERYDGVVSRIRAGWANFMRSPSPRGSSVEEIGDDPGIDYTPEA